MEKRRSGTRHSSNPERFLVTTVSAAQAPLALATPTLAHTSVPILGRSTPFPVRRIYCVGRNYVDHIREMKEGDERDPPFFFQKPSDAIVTNGKVPYPCNTEDFQFELELVVAIGATPPAQAHERALESVLGYAVGLDMTRRDRQRECLQQSRLGARQIL